jgi:hypothetical protein
MSFINHLISSHTESTGKVLPRLQGSFESFTTSPQMQDAGDAAAGFTTAIEHQPVSARDRPYTTLQEKNNGDEHLLVAKTFSMRETASQAAGNDSPQHNRGMQPENIFPAGAGQPVNMETPADNNMQTDRFKNLSIPVATTAARPGFASAGAAGNGHIQPVLVQQPLIQDNPAWINEFKNKIGNDTSAGGSKAASQPVIRINIHRIDVRAITTPVQPRETARSKAGISLDEFLKKKNSHQ